MRTPKDARPTKRQVREAKAANNRQRLAAQNPSREEEFFDLCRRQTDAQERIATALEKLAVLPARRR
jgi:hypothetical protein